jgi:hypothetical protein
MPCMRVSVVFCVASISESVINHMLPQAVGLRHRMVACVETLQRSRETNLVPVAMRLLINPPFLCRGIVAYVKYLDRKGKRCYP